ncbi:MAG TPA: hypothetical protein VMV69_12120 [Pirellulales bacterium]|nr:hypothetical protein [Pirellulales bacterium]
MSFAPLLVGALGSIDALVMITRVIVATQHQPSPAEVSIAGTPGVPAIVLASSQYDSMNNRTQFTATVAGVANFRPGSNAGDKSGVRGGSGSHPTNATDGRYEQDDQSVIECKSQGGTTAWTAGCQPRSGDRV